MMGEVMSCIKGQVRVSYFSFEIKTKKRLLHLCCLNFEFIFIEF